MYGVCELATNSLVQTSRYIAIGVPDHIFLGLFRCAPDREEWREHPRIPRINGYLFLYSSKG